MVVMNYKIYKSVFLNYTTITMTITPIIKYRTIRSTSKDNLLVHRVPHNYYNTITLSEESGVSAVGNHLSILKDILQLANRHRSELQLQQLLSFLHLSS